MRTATNSTGSSRNGGGQAAVLALLAAALLPVAAAAADLSAPVSPIYTKAPPMPVSAAHDWSGFYAGAHVGFDWGRARVVDNGVLTESGAPMNGAIGGLLAGINWQSGQFVYGLEGDFGAAALRGHGTAAAATPDFVPNQYDVNFSANIRGRAGVAVLPRTLIYAAGGLALAEFRFRENSGPLEVSNLLTGWTAGAGVDHAFAPNLIGRLEYLYADYGRKDFTVVPGDIYNIGFRTHTLRAALISNFDGDRAGGGHAMAMEAPMSNWSGFYIGGDVGEAFQHLGGNSNFFQNVGPNDPLNNNIQRQTANGKTAAGGFHAGYNWQFAPSWVIGLEGDYQWIAAKYAGCRQTDTSSVACRDNDFGFVNISGETRSIATVRGRLGATFDRVMVYGTGGVAFADVQTVLGVSCAAAGCGQSGARISEAVNFSTEKTGWAAGAGAEWMLNPNWIVRAEYLHAGFGHLSDTLNLPAAACVFGGPCGVSWARDLHYDIVRAGLSYKFGG